MQSWRKLPDNFMECETDISDCTICVEGGGAPRNQVFAIRREILISQHQIMSFCVQKRSVNIRFCVEDNCFFCIIHFTLVSVTCYKIVDCFTKIICVILYHNNLMNCKSIKMYK